MTVWLKLASEELNSWKITDKVFALARSGRFKHCETDNVHKLVKLVILRFEMHRIKFT